jgi:UDP-N-acetylmuramoyl-tripeptide--D-alanyl-D-alanine ligase
MKFLSTNWVSRALGQAIGVDQHLTQISSDTRELKHGSLFVALKGEASDGHDHVEKAKAQGAVALIHKKGTPCPEGMRSFPVEDTLEAWRSISGAWRREFTIPIAVVAGSAGKTTSKELLAALFRGKFKNVLHTEASQNGFQGVPTTLLRLRPEHDAAVIEVGIDEPGSMIQHLELVAPDAGVLTSIGPEHLEKLGDLETVEKEEGLLFAVLAIRGGLAAVNLDDFRIERQSEQINESNKITYSLRGAEGAAVRGQLSVGKNDEVWIDVTGLSSKGHDRFRVPLEGAHNAQNLLGALTLAHGLGLSLAELYKGLLTFKAPPGRSEVHHWKGCKVLADTYNANPTSVEAALETLFGTATDHDGETWVCLGDMLELGRFEEAMHRGLADPLLKHGVKNVFLYGPRMKNLEHELRTRRFAGTLAHFDSQELMAARISKSAHSGDRILIKGSRGMRMENVWKALQGT